MESPSKERLLQDDLADEISSFPYQLPKSQFSGSFAIKFMLVTIICLLGSNTFLLVHYQAAQKERRHVLGSSQYAELAFDTPVVYHNYTDYWGSNQTLADELWDSIDTSPLVVALGDDWAKKHNLPLSIFRFPWDPSAKGVYYLKAFHGLHCLKSMRKAYIEYERGLTPTIHAGHFHHCIDALRQDVLCYADDTPMPMHDFPNKVGNNQIRTCRNFDRLIEWTREPERHACYHRWSDYKGMPKNKLEMFAFCDKDSEYHPLMKAYFEKFGHKPLYGADDHFRSS